MEGCTTNAGMLLDYVKAQLGVTWQDSATDALYLQLIQDAMAYFDEKLGSGGDYTSPRLRELVKERVRYARDNALEVFENNFQAAILAAQNHVKVANYGSTVSETQSGQ